LDTKTFKNEIHSMNFKNRNKRTIVFAAVIAFILVALLIITFIYNERKSRIAETEKTLVDITERDAAIVRNFFDSYVTILRAISFNMRNFDDLTSAQSFGLLREMGESFEFESLSIDFLDGRSFTTDSIEHKITDEKHLVYLQRGQSFITDIIKSTDDMPMVCIHVPINRNSRTVAFLSCKLTREKLNGVFKSVLSEENKYFYIIDGYGEYVAYITSANSVFSADINYFETLDRIIFAEGAIKEQIMQVFTGDVQAVNAEYWFEGLDHRHGYFSPVGINNWVMVLVASKSEINSDTNRFLTNALVFSALLLMIFLFVAILVFIDQVKARRLTELNERCFHILAQHTGKVVFEWDYINKTMQYTNLEQTVGRERIKTNLNSADDVIKTGAVHPDDSEALYNMFSDVMDGRNLENLRLRLRITDETYHYFSVSSVVIFDAKEKPYKSIGFMENIDKQVRTEINLRHRANIDLLTELYNKAATEALISEVISSSDNNTKHALLCVDLDNFKNINDVFGHLYGDKVLKETTDDIKKLFRTSDIIGRFGGDEFVIFIRDIPGMLFIEEKAAELNKCLNRTYRDEDNECTVSASIGIAVFPDNGLSYKTLYQKADEASYVVKNTGKNSYGFAVLDRTQDS
jgi:diguanylate cyclase (GGDEF)-like protein